MIGRGIAASPGAATGKIVFTARAAQAAPAQDEPCILVRRETTPEDIRGMHAARAVLTERGGVTSHAAVIARGLGLPCVVGAATPADRPQGTTLTAADGRVFREGDVITIDGTAGDALAGAAPMLAPALGENFQHAPRLGRRGARHRRARQRRHARGCPHRASGSTPRASGCAGPNTCSSRRTGSLAMREMIFADDRRRPPRRSLERILPMQRADFIELVRDHGTASQ